MALRHARIHPVALHFHAAPIHPLGLRQQLQQCPIAAADIDHTRQGLDHFSDQQMIRTLYVR
jgi:hypothetical protein